MKWVLLLLFTMSSGAWSVTEGSLCDIIMKMRKMRTRVYLDKPGWIATQKAYLEQVENLANEKGLGASIDFLNKDKTWFLIPNTQKHSPELVFKNQKKIKNSLLNAIETYEEKFRQNLEGLTDQQLLDLYWQQRKNGFLDFTVKNDYLAKQLVKKREESWQQLLDGMGWFDYTKRFWHEISEAPSILGKVKRIFVSKYNPSRLVDESVTGLFRGREPFYHAPAKYNIFRQPIHMAKETNFFLTEKILRQKGKRLNLTNFARRQTERLLLKDGEHFTLTTRLASGAVVSYYSYPYISKGIGYLLDPVWRWSTKNNYLQQIKSDFRFRGIKAKLDFAEQNPDKLSYSELDAMNEAHVLNEAYVALTKKINERSLKKFSYLSPEDKVSKYFSNQELLPILIPLLDYLPEEDVKPLTLIQDGENEEEIVKKIADWSRNLPDSSIRKLGQAISVLEVKVKLWQIIPTFFDKEFDHQKFKKEMQAFEKKSLPLLNKLENVPILVEADKKILENLKFQKNIFFYYKSIFKDNVVLQPHYYRKEMTADVKASISKFEFDDKRAKPHYYLDLNKYKIEGLLSEEEFVYKIQEDLQWQADWGMEKIVGASEGPQIDIRALRWKSRLDLEKRYSSSK